MWRRIYSAGLLSFAESYLNSLLSRTPGQRGRVRQVGQRYWVELRL